MTNSLYHKLLQALKQAENHNGNIMVKPEVILWPDPECQWAEVIPTIQELYPNLIIYGKYDPAKKQGPSIWLKCMVAKMLPEANWVDGIIPIIYLPGVAKSDLRNVEDAGLDFQPLLEYQYTGSIFLQENGKEWTILAFAENPISGLGLKVSKDSATKDALKKSLPTIFQDAEILHGKSIVDAEFLNNQLFPDMIPNILKWMCKGDSFLSHMDLGKREVFRNLCKSQYDFEPDHKNIKAIAEKLGAQRNSWKYVWQLYATAPHKYPEVEDLLRLAKPTDLGNGIFSFPEESWPQVNEVQEEELGIGLSKAAKQSAKDALKSLIALEEANKKRRNWVWYELSKSPLANALQYLVTMAKKATEPFPSASIHELRDYYIADGLGIDQAMRKAYTVVKSEKDKSIVKSLIQLIYQPWFESITNKFQKLVESSATIFTNQQASEEQETFVLFVDAFRYELAEEFCRRLAKYKYKISLSAGWSAIPSLTPSAKPSVSPIAISVSTNSEIKEFRPQLQNGKDLQHPAFKESLVAHGFKLISNSGDITTVVKCWQEIGDIDKTGHKEQADMVKRIDELFEQVQEAIDVAFEKGVKKIKIVTDHGWLLLPGGLPKTQLNEGLTETRWGRCAYIKEDAKTDLLHLPWRWNPNLFIAYAPGISFFKANVEYAHGGISIHECLVPEIIIENTNAISSTARIKDIKWVNLKCAVTTEGATDDYTIDVRAKYNDDTTSIVESKNKAIKDNRGSLMVSDDAESQAATVVLIDQNGRIIDRKPTTVGG